MTAVDVDALAKLREAAWKTAVTVRPHYPPCDFPDHACACGAAEDRPKIVEALLAEVRRGRARREAVEGLRHNLCELCDSAADGYVPVVWLRDLLAAVDGGEQR